MKELFRWRPGSWVVFAWGVACWLGLAQTARAGGGAAWTEIPMSPRIASLGRIVTVGARPWEAPLVNVAAIAGGRGDALAVSRVAWIQGVRAQQAVFVHSGGRLSLALWAGLLEVPGIERRTARDELIGEFTAHHVRAGAGMARSLGRGVEVGLAVEWLFQKIDVYEAGAISVDLGLRKDDLPAGLAAALAVRGLPLTESLGQGGLSPTTGISAGLAWWFAVGERADAFRLEVDALYAEGGSFRAAGGLEVRPVRALELRLGYLSGLDLQGFSFGLGLRMARFCIDYGYLPFRQGFGNVHSFGVALRL